MTGQDSPRRGLVLGVSSDNSVGFHTARALRQQGADVVVTCRPKRRRACEALTDSLGIPPPLEVDFDDDDAIVQALSRLGWDRLDFLVHTLVHVPEGALTRPLLATTRSDFVATMSGSVWSFVRACQAATSMLERSDAPRVVTLTSAGSNRMMPGYHLAGIGKAALEAALRYAAFELGPKGILVNAVSFSLLETDGAIRAIGGERAAAARSHMTKRTPTRRAVDFGHVTEAIAFLVSPRCQNVTGEILTVDGGLSKLYF